MLWIFPATWYIVKQTEQQENIEEELNPWNWDSCCYCSSCYRCRCGARFLPPSKIMRSPCIIYIWSPFYIPSANRFVFSHRGGSSRCHSLNLASSSVCGAMLMWPPVNRWLPRPISGNYTVCVTSDKNLDPVCENGYFPIKRSSALSTQSWLCCETAP